MSIKNSSLSMPVVKLRILMVVSAFLVYAAFSPIRPDQLDIFPFWIFSTVSFLIASWVFLPLRGLKKSVAMSLASAVSVLLSVAVLFGCLFIFKLGFASGYGEKLKPSIILENIPDFIVLCLSASFFCWAWLSIFVANLMVIVVSKSYKKMP